MSFVVNPVLFSRAWPAPTDRGGRVAACFKTDIDNLGYYVDPE